MIKSLGMKTSEGKAFQAKGPVNAKSLRCLGRKWRWPHPHKKEHAGLHVVS